MTPERIWIFLDDSNLWIEAKKAKGTDLKRKEFKEDPRLRIEFGELATVISHGRQIRGTTLYGSEPPPSDSVWKKGREQGWKPKVFQKSSWSGKEKRIDTQIACDVTELVCDNPNQEHRSTVAIVSGDIDMYPCIEKAISRQWNVEVWAMENSLSEGLKSLNKSNQFLKVQVFSREHLEKITYIKEEFTYHSERKGDMLRRGVVLQQCQLQREKSIDFMDGIKKILDSFNWPWQYTRLKPEVPANILVLFCRTQGESDDTVTSLNLYKPELEKKCVPKLCKHVLTYFQYDKSDNQYKTPIETHNRYGSLPDVQDTDDVKTPSAATDKISEIDSNFSQVSGHTDHDEDSNPAGNSSKEPFEPVETKKSKRPSKRYQRSSGHCRYQYQCFKGIKCTHYHTINQKTFFKSRNSCVEHITDYDLRTYKTSLCKRRQLCPNEDACTYAHSEDEQVCRECKNLGHATEKCPKNATDQKK